MHSACGQACVHLQGKVTRVTESLEESTSTVSTSFARTSLACIGMKCHLTEAAVSMHGDAGLVMHGKLEFPV